MLDLILMVSSNLIDSMILLVAILISYSIPERAVQFSWVTWGISDFPGLSASYLFAAAEAEECQSYLKSELHASSKA